VQKQIKSMNIKASEKINMECQSSQPSNDRLIFFPTDGSNIS